MNNNLQNKLKLYHRYNMFLQKISVKSVVKYTCTLVRIYTNIHIPIDTYTLIMFMFKTYDSFHSPAINIHIGYIYIDSSPCDTGRRFKRKEPNCNKKDINTYSNSRARCKHEHARSGICVTNISCATQLISLSS